MAPLTADRLRQLLSYDRDTGEFTWIAKSRRGSNAKIGSQAGTILAKGHVLIGVDGRFYLAHRLAYLYIIGRWPENQIDHRDLDRSNNAWANLREATNQQNCANRAAFRTNVLGVKGVSKTTSGRYAATITKNGRRYHLGSFDTVEDASAAYSRSATAHFGDFARSK